MTGVFDESGGFDTSKLEDYDSDQLDDYYDQTLGEKNELSEEHGDNLGTPVSVRVKYREFDRRIRVIDEERNRRESRKDRRGKSKSKKDRHEESETPLFDDSSDYKRSDLYVLRVDGKRDNLSGFINGYIDRHGKVNRGATDSQKAIISRFLKSYLAISDGDGVRPLLNSRYNYELQRGTTFGRSGNNNDASLTTFLNYKGVDVREVNINTGVTGRLNRNSEKERQFSVLVRGIFNYNGEVIKELSRKTKRSPVAVQEMLDNDDTTAEFVERGVSSNSVEQISWKTGVSLELVKEIEKRESNSVEQISKETGVPPEKVKKLIEKREDSVEQISRETGVRPEKVKVIAERDDSVEQISRETGVGLELVKEIEKRESNSVKQISKETGVRPEQVRLIIREDGAIMGKVSRETGVGLELVKVIIEKDSDNVKQMSEETGVRPELVNEIVKERPRFIEITDGVIKRIQEGRIKDLESRKLQRPKEQGGPDLEGERLRALRKQIEKIPDDLRGRKYPSIVLPKVVEDEIIGNSVSKISSSLHSHEREIELLVLTDQELREFTGILNPKGDADTRIGALGVTADEYRLKALREAEPRKEQLYKNIQETAELKTDLIFIIEKGEAPKNSEAISIFKEEIDNNESVSDISRLERFKKWIKENWLGASALIITIASLLTTVIVTARHAISKGARAVKSFGQSVYKIFRNIDKKLGPVLGPVISATGSLLSVLLKYAAEGIAWLAKDLWALVIAIVFLIYERYRRKKK